MIGIKKPSASSRGRVYPVVPPQFAAKYGLIRSQQTVSAIPGAPVSAYCMFQQSRSERNSAPSFLLPCTKRQLSERRMMGAYWVSSSRSICFYNFTTFSTQSQRVETTTIGKKQHTFLCTLTWTSVRAGWNWRIRQVCLPFLCNSNVSFSKHRH